MLTRSEINRKYWQSEKGREVRRRWNGIYNCSDKSREARRRYKYSDKGKEALARYYHSEAKKKADARYREKNKWKQVVYNLVQRAKKVGILLSRPCQVCGKTNALAHHDDYTKPLEVKWLCNYHHSEYHRRLGG